MRQFTDRQGRQWQIDLNIGNVFHVRDASDGRFDLLGPAKLVDEKPLQVVLASDLLEFWKVLWRLVERQAEQTSVTNEAFGQAMAADCLVEAQQLFFLEWRDFFLSLRRPDAALSVESQGNMLTTAVKLVKDRVDEIDRTKLNRKMESEVGQAVSAAFGTVQASLDAIPDPTPGDNST